MLDQLYGPHKGTSNLGRFDLPEFNALYDKAKQMPNGPERVQIFRRMSSLVTAYAPWVLNTYRIENIVVHPWVLGYKRKANDSPDRENQFYGASCLRSWSTSTDSR